MKKNIFTSKVNAVENDIKGTIKTQVEKTLKSVDTPHYIELNEGVEALYDDYIYEVHLIDDEVVFFDQEQDTFNLDDAKIPLQALAQIADELVNEEFEVLLFEE